jgi:hypothetical protein
MSWVRWTRSPRATGDSDVALKWEPRRAPRRSPDTHGRATGRRARWSGALVGPRPAGTPCVLNKQVRGRDYDPRNERRTQQNIDDESGHGPSPHYSGPLTPRAYATPVAWRKGDGGLSKFRQRCERPNAQYKIEQRNSRRKKIRPPCRN